MQAVTEGVATEGSRNFSGEGPASCGGRQWSQGQVPGPDGITLGGMCV